MMSPSQIAIGLRERGSALIITMLLLVAMATIGFAAMNSSNLQERIAGNERDRGIAFSAAESALRNAEDYLRSLPVLPVFDPTVTPGHYRMNQIAALTAAIPSAGTLAPNATVDVISEEVWASDAAIGFMKTTGIVYGSLKSAPAIEDLTAAQQPRVIFEEMPASAPYPTTIRITAVGWGNNGGIVVLQSYYTPPQFTATS
jgi:type IV pilus assembly protein PilX